MIQFSFDWDSVFNQVVLALAILMMPIMLWLLIFHRKPDFTGRLMVRVGLNVLLWLAVVSFILQPSIRKEKTGNIGLLIGEDVPAEVRNQLTDSLKTAEKIDLSGLTSIDNLSEIDTLLVVGQDFNKAIFERLLLAEQHPALKWIPFYKKNKPTTVAWNGILRKGETQVLQGKIVLDSNQSLSVRYSDQILNSIHLPAGDNTFKLSFPVFTEGRTLATLNLGKTTLDTIRFFARPAEMLTFQFILDNPDFDTRNLATWLGKNGHSVIYDATLARNLQSRQSINMAKTPDVVVTIPGNASHAVVKKALAAGKSVLFINLTNPATEIPQINAALGTKLAVRKISSEETVPITQELAALPFQFVESDFYATSAPYPVAVQRSKGSVGVSMLSETFPLMLSGDSLSYQKVWSNIIAAVHPPTESNVSVRAPIHQNMRTSVYLNNFPNNPKLLRIGSDTVFLDHSAINGKSTTGNFRALESGWLAVSDTLQSEIYVETAEGQINVTVLKDFIGAYSLVSNRQYTTAKDINQSNDISQKLPDWAWLILILFCLTALWVESKL
jgi:hypothetical protein